MFFILSPYPKTGTTLMLESINQHPDTGKRNFIENYPLAKMLDAAGEIQNQKRLYKILEEKDAGWIEVTKKFVFEMIEKDGPYFSLFGTKFSCFRNAPFINKIFPEAKIIYMRRDPRDAYSSYKAMELERGNEHIHATLWIRKYFTSFEGTEYLRNVLFIDYEELIRDYKNTMSKVWEHLEVKPFHLKTRLFSIDIFNRFSKQSKLRSVIASDGLCKDRIGRFEYDLTEGEIYEFRRDISLFVETNKRLKFGNQSWTSLEIPRDGPLISVDKKRSREKRDI